MVQATENRFRDDSRVAGDGVAGRERRRGIALAWLRHARPEGHVGVGTQWELRGLGNLKLWIASSELPTGVV